MGRKDHPTARAFASGVAERFPFALARGELVFETRYADDFGLVVSIRRMPGWALNEAWLRGCRTAPLLTAAGERIYGHLRDEGMKLLAADGFRLCALVLMPEALVHAAERLSVAA